MVVGATIDYGIRNSSHSFNVNMSFGESFGRFELTPIIADGIIKFA